MTGLSAAGRARLQAIRDASSLTELRALYDASDEHAAYFDAKQEWRLLRGRELNGSGPTPGGVPGASVEVDGREFVVHGVTHAGTDAEREFLRAHVDGILAAGGSVYCEQGIRGMYFADLDVCVMDDYRWALRECERRGIESHVEGDPFDSLREDVGAVASQFQDVVFELIDGSSERFGREFEAALANVAGVFVTSHTDRSLGSEFTSFRLRETAAEKPSELWKLQRYYECAFLPAPLEREWLRRHDPELELVTHARSERMAAYALAEAPAEVDVHLVVGAAHQPGVRYYLEQFAAEGRDFADFEVVLE
jgi:hypothetical protein